MHGSSAMAKKRMEVVPVRLPPEIIDELKKLGERDDRPVSYMVRKIVLDYFKENPSLSFYESDSLLVQAIAQEIGLQLRPDSKEGQIVQLRGQLGGLKADEFKALPKWIQNWYNEPGE